MRRFFCTFLLLIVFAGSALHAETFSVDRYDIDIEIGPDSKCHVVETLALYFHEPSHGIYRDIQYRFDDGGLEERSAEVSGFSASIPFSVEKSGQFVSFRLGDPSSYMVGENIIELSYDFLLSDDYERGYDEWYYNIVAPAWGTYIDEVRFRVTFPYPTDMSSIHATWGRYGSTDGLDTLELSDDGRVLVGRAYGLGPYEAVTVRAEFPEGYFDQAEKHVDLTPILCIVYMVAASFLFLLFYREYRKYGVDDELVVVPRFEAPEGCDPLRCAYLYDGAKDAETVFLAMLYHWADRGYVKITDAGEGKARSISFSSICPLPESSSDGARRLHSLIFAESGTVDLEDMARRNVAEKYQREVVSSERRFCEKTEPIWDRAAERASSTMLSLSLLFVPLSVLLALGRGFSELSVVIFMLSLFQFVLSILVGRPIGSNGIGKSSVFRKTILAILNAVAAFFAFVLIDGCRTVPSVLLASAFVFEAVLSASLSIFPAATRRRSELGTRLYGELYGYREFIEYVEEDRLKVLVDEDPEFFYHVLCYAMVFGLAERFMEKFKHISFVNPSWYEGPGVVDYMFWSSFGRRYRNEFASARRSFAPTSTRSGGSFHSSSGFSGGGFSGGGGRSW